MTFAFISLEYFFLTSLVAHPLNESLHFPYAVTALLVQSAVLNVTLHDGFVLSTFTISVAGHVVSFPATSFTIPGDIFALASVLIVLDTVLVSQPAPSPSSIHVPIIVLD